MVCFEAPGHGDLAHRGAQVPVLALMLESDVGDLLALGAFLHLLSTFTFGSQVPTGSRLAPDEFTIAPYAPAA